MHTPGRITTQEIGLRPIQTQPPAFEGVETYLAYAVEELVVTATDRRDYARTALTEGTPWRARCRRQGRTDNRRRERRRRYCGGRARAPARSALSD